MCDEAHFWLNGYVNKQNCRIWSEANPQVYVETPLHPEKLTVWCALWAGGIIGPYFFENDEGHNVTVNGDRYRAMITNFFIPELNNHDVQELWFQQDDATCHTARAIIDLLKDTFGDRLISRFGPANWPPRSCDSTPLDYFLWGYVKSLVYADKPQTLDHLEGNIRRVIADIRPQMLEKVIENWTSRLDYIRASRDSHMLEILFKILGESAPSFSAVKYWVEDFKLGHTICQDEQRSGRPNEVTTPKMVKKIFKAVLDDRRLKMRYIADIVVMVHYFAVMGAERSSNDSTTSHMYFEAGFTTGTSFMRSLKNHVMLETDLDEPILEFACVYG
ncbi:transposable element Tc3 transposase [Trichonephila clavipes]|nr:transposable element Tc3 transposase [Trichonephila clavipes]